jgi:hypothetical protein
MLHPFDWQPRIEAPLGAQPIGFSVLRASPFTDLLALAPDRVRSGTWGGAAGDGLVNLVDVRMSRSGATSRALIQPHEDRSRHAAHHRRNRERRRH